MALDRRDFLKSGAATAASLSWLSACTAFGAAQDPGPFLHGVASGDPLGDRVILWTRVTPPERETGDVEVEWRVARDPQLRDRVAGGRAVARAARDHTVKVDAAGLAPGATCYYGFRALGAASPVGRTRTLPEGPVERLRLAFCSCSSLPWGFFNAYGEIARRADLDAVLHLGDYLYEQPNGAYGDGTATGRIPRPDHEIVSLADYRTRHAQYKADPDAQAMHRQHPFIAVWDDHEFTNDAWRDGAQNHQRAEGGWPERRAAAVQAYFEWMPIREVGDAGEPVIYRRFRFGDLVDLFMLDTRIVGRDRILPRGDAGLADSARSLLGPEQERWLFERLRASRREGVAWRVIGQQVLLAPARNRDGSVVSTDKWDGYPATRGRLFDVLEQDAIGDNVILTGDFHSSWALDVPRDPFRRKGYHRDSGRGSLAVEFVTPGISAPGFLDPEEARSRSEAMQASNPHLHWVDFHHRGYGLLDVDRQRAQCEWWFVDTVDERRSGERFARAFATARGRDHLRPVSSPSEPRGNPPPLA